MKKLKSVLSILVVCALIISVFAGCGQTNKAQKDDTTPNNTETQSAKTGTEEEVKVAIILKTLANPFWVAMKEGIEKEAEAQNVKVDIFAVDSEDDVQGQLKKFEDILAQNYYNAIGFAPISPVNLIPAIAQATKAGIPVVNIDERVDSNELKNAGGKILSFVTTDNIKVGEKGAKAIVDKIGAEGDVAIIEGKAGNATGESRRDGAKAYFESQSDIKLVASQPADWDRVKALDVATNIIQKYPNLKGIYCANDTMALGAIQAVQNAGMEGKIFVVGTDGIPEAVEAVEDGALLGTVAQDPAQVGVTTLNILIDAVKNNKTASDAEAEMVAVDSKLITK